MSAAGKSFYWQRLKAAGVEFERPYVQYKLAELEAAHAFAVEQGVLEEPTEQELTELESRVHAPKPGAGRRKKSSAPPPMPPEPDPLEAFVAPPPMPPAVARNPVAAQPPVPVRGPDPNELPGQRLNTKPDDEPIRVDEQGRVWLQEEVKKPAYPKPRGRRVLRYMDPGVEKQTIKDGEYTETFEVSGDPRNATPAEVKITLPSYQVGVYRDPRFPFKVITYNGVVGFDREEVNAFYGGPELVPAEVKRIYVENVLCYDVRTVIRAIQTEYRQQQLAGRI